jgi:hypothetical protein
MIEITSLEFQEPARAVVRQRSDDTDGIESLHP